jgi:putative ABC transport system permease protein
VLIDAIGVRPTFVLSPLAVIAAVATGTLATVVATALPARSATSVPPVEAMRPEGILEGGDGSAVRWWQLIGGVVAFVIGTVLAITAAGDLALASIALITIGFIVATAGAMGPLAWMAAAIANLFGAPGRLAGAALERSPRRVWATTLAVVVAVGQVIAFRSLTANQSDTFGAQIQSLARPDLWVQTSPLEQFPADVRISRDWVGRVAAVPGVASVRPGQATYATVLGERLIIEGVEQNPAAPLIAVSPPGPRRAVVEGRAISVSRTFAQHHHLEVGDQFTLATARGPQRLPIAAVNDVPLPVLSGGIGLSLEHLETWFGQPGATWLEVQLDPGANRDTVRRDVSHVMRGAGVRIWVSPGTDVLAAARRSIDSTQNLFRAMQWVIVGATALAVLNTLLISVVERRRELGILRAVGTSRRTVRRMVGAEAAAIGVLGAVLGVSFGVLEHAVAVVAVRGLTGFHVRYAFLIAPVFVGVASAAAVVALGSLAPAWRAARTNVIEAIGYE